MVDTHNLSIFIDAWKAVSIGVTGLLGILGLLTEFRDKKTTKITRAGCWTLALIFISASLGVLAQVVDNITQAEANRIQLERLVTIAAQTQKAVEASNVLLTPITDPILELDYRIKCPDPAAASFCELASQKPFYSNVWPSSKVPGFGVINLAFLAGKPRFDGNRVYNAELSFYALQDRTGLSVTRLKNGEFDVRIDGHMTVNDGGRLTSFLQLKDRTMIISAGKSPLAGRVPYYVTVQNRSGQHVAIWSCELAPLRDGPAFALVHRFDEDVTSQVMPFAAGAPPPARDRANACKGGLAPVPAHPS